MPHETALFSEENGVKILSFVRDAQGNADLDLTRHYFANNLLPDTQGWPRLVIDFTGVVTLDSASLGPLVQKLRDTQDMKGSLALTGITGPALREIFAITRFDKVFAIYPSRAEAISAAALS